jgi:hypothetical protein
MDTEWLLQAAASDGRKELLLLPTHCCMQAPLAATTFFYGLKSALLTVLSLTLSACPFF